MNRTESDAILRLSIQERLRRVELSWESIAATPSAVPLGDAHRAVIDERRAEHARAPDDVLSR